jgi:hypothetical protein
MIPRPFLLLAILPAFAAVPGGASAGICPAFIVQQTPESTISNRNGVRWYTWRAIIRNDSRVMGTTVVRVSLVGVPQLTQQRLNSPATLRVQAGIRMSVTVGETTTHLIHPDVRPGIRLDCD